MAASTAPSRIAVIALALSCAAALIVLCFPGYVSHDVRYQLAQALQGPITDVSPPGQVLLLRALQPLWTGTGALFVLNQLMFWTACAVLELTGHRRWAAAAFVLLVALCPPLLLLQPQVWTDLHLLAVLALGFALTLRARRAASRAGRYALWWLSLGLMLWAIWVRQNAVLAVIPLLWLLAAGTRPEESKPRRRAWVFTGLLLIMVFSRQLAALPVQLSVSVWAVTPMWDLQALSLAADEVLLPEEMVGPGMSVDELRQAYSPHTAVSLFANTPSGVRDPTSERFSAAQRNRLLKAWLTAIAAEPVAWVAHRSRVFAALFTAHRFGELRHMVDSPEFLSAEQAPAGWRGDWHAHWRVGVEALKASAVVQAWPWFVLVLLGLLALGLLRRRWPPQSARCLLISAALYAGSLWLLTPSAELRYLAWPLWASLAALYLSFCATAPGSRSA